MQQAKNTPRCWAEVCLCDERPRNHRIRLLHRPRKHVTAYPTPAELWQRYRRGSGLQRRPRSRPLLTPSNHAVGKGERYYQQIAINRTVEAILKGTAPTACSRWPPAQARPRSRFRFAGSSGTAAGTARGEYRRPRILYLADRNILVDQPKDGIFAAFGDARHKIEGGEVVKSREMYFAIYQAIAEDERRAGRFQIYPDGFL